MKKELLFSLFLFGFIQLIFLFQSNNIIAQEACTDTIFPTKTKGIISDCCIEKVDNGNFVIYKKKGQSYAVEALAIIKDGLYIPLTSPTNSPPVKLENNTVTPKVQKPGRYKYDYDLYAKRHRTGRTIGTIGGFVAIAGAAMTIGSLVANANGNMTYDRAQTMVIVGFFAFNFGAPTAFVGLAMAKNSKEAMLYTKQESLDLSFGITTNGVGLVLKL